MTLTQNAKNDPVKISVVIPTCHRNDLLAKCLDCLAPGVQTLPPSQYEVIVTDDGSQSTAEQMMRERYPWAHWIAGPRRGPAANRNHGAKQTAGEFIAFTDDDCLPEPEWLEAFTKAIAPEVFVYEGKTVCREGFRSCLESAPCNETGGYLWSCNMAVERNLFALLEGFDEAFPYPAMEDVDFRERLRDKGFRFLFVSDAIVDHPPNRLPGGKRRGKLWESQIYYFAKSGKYSGDLRWFICLLLFNHKARAIYKLRLQWAMFPFIFSTLIESAYVLLHLNSWFYKYKSHAVRKSIVKGTL